MKTKTTTIPKSGKIGEVVLTAKQRETIVKNSPEFLPKRHDEALQSGLSPSNPTGNKLHGVLTPAKNAPGKQFVERVSKTAYLDDVVALLKSSKVPMSPAELHNLVQRNNRGYVVGSTAIRHAIYCGQQAGLPIVFAGVVNRSHTYTYGK